MAGRPPGLLPTVKPERQEEIPDAAVKGEVNRLISNRRRISRHREERQ